MTRAACQQCGKPESVRAGRRFCSRQCMGASQAKAIEVRLCEQCGGEIERKAFASTGRPESPGSYANRRFCSRACVAASRAGIPAGWRKPTPDRSCANCGLPMDRRDYGRRIESVYAFSKRQACSPECRDSLRSGTSHWHRNPQAVGRRILVARTCVDCGDLKDASAFMETGAGYKNSRCSVCSSGLYRERRSAEQHSRDKDRSRRALARKQAQSLATAVHYAEEWTGPQLEIAMRSDLSVAEIAAILGRSYSAVIHARGEVKADPRKNFLAGMSRGEPI